MRLSRCSNIISIGTIKKTISWSHSFKRSISYRSLDKTRIVLCFYRSLPHTPMGKKVLQCFPWYKRGKDRSKGGLCPTQAVPSVEVQPGVPPTVSWGYDGVESSARPVYFSHKARVAYRHQMDGNIIDATC
ncbi:hypothetical protein E1301_Tti000444 [Triplophysa tibetana]|uniref:Uncharacterized protein n=1 Tax=Triplophysa tibetana TaxID=1572043 RepID=A0A5A9N1J6_9TELE|nr:hypothetical protein E1301_Tti000444 [Triplophysa tibetana]